VEIGYVNENDIGDILSFGGSVTPISIGSESVG